MKLQSRRVSLESDYFCLTKKDLEFCEILLEPYRLRARTVFLYWLFRSINALDIAIANKVGGERAVSRVKARRIELDWPNVKAKV